MKDLSHPNGLLWLDGDLIIGGWGKDIQHDFSSKVAASLLKIDNHSKLLTTIANGYEMGNLDGVVKIKDALYVRPNDAR